MRLSILLFLAVMSVATPDGNIGLTLTKDSISLRSVKGVPRWSIPSPFLHGAAYATSLTPTLVIVAGTLDKRLNNGLLLVLDRRSGRELWRVRVDGNPTRVGQVGPNVFVQYAHSGNEIVSISAGYDVKTHQQRWEIGDVSGVEASSGDMLIFQDNMFPDFYHPEEVRAWRLATDTQQRNLLVFKVLPRPGCGEPRILDPRRVNTYDARYAYAHREDACGTFVARFDWHQSADQKPLVYPKP